jgi:tartrate/fumarate subfamily iron-sulfur-dependent hydro-lyase alpha chain
MRPDVLAALQVALEKESQPRARQVLGMLIENAELAAAKRLPLCQDTGSVWVLLELGRSVNSGRPLAAPSDLFSQVDSTIRWVWREHRLRASLLEDALLDRTNSRDNTPAFTEISLKPEMLGARLTVMLKGGGSDNASMLAMLTPGEGWLAIHQLVINHVLSKAANACPPLVIGVGVGTTFDKVAGLAKQAMLRPIGAANPDARLAQMEQTLMAEINSSGIGPGGLGGETTALAVSIKTAPCHIASLPVAICLGCVATRAVSFQLTGEWM